MMFRATMMRCFSIHIFPSSSSFSVSSSSFSSSFPWQPNPPLHWSLKTKCRERKSDDETFMNMSSSPYQVLGISPDNCSPSHLKAAFRAKVKEFHPDVRRDEQSSDTMIRRVIWAYQERVAKFHFTFFIEFVNVVLLFLQTLSNLTKTEIIERECLDPFDEPECEAFDIFVNESLCAGKGCPSSCVARASYAFAFAPSTGTARVTSQGHGEDYQVQLAVGQCPRSCIHFVTPSQRIVLEELLESILNVPYDTSAEADLLYSLIVKAKFENNRYHKPKKQPKVSTDRVDWY